MKKLRICQTPAPVRLQRPLLPVWARLVLPGLAVVACVAIGSAQALGQDYEIGSGGAANIVIDRLGASGCPVTRDWVLLGFSTSNRALCQNLPTGWFTFFDSRAYFIDQDRLWCLLPDGTEVTLRRDKGDPSLMKWGAWRARLLERQLKVESPDGLTFLFENGRLSSASTSDDSLRIYRSQRGSRLVSRDDKVLVDQHIGTGIRNHICEIELGNGKSLKVYQEKMDSLEAVPFKGSAVGQASGWKVSKAVFDDKSMTFRRSISGAQGGLSIANDDHASDSLTYEWNLQSGALSRVGDIRMKRDEEGNIQYSVGGVPIHSSRGPSGGFAHEMTDKYGRTVNASAIMLGGNGRFYPRVRSVTVGGKQEVVDRYSYDHLHRPLRRRMLTTATGIGPLHGSTVQMEPL